MTSTVTSQYTIQHTISLLAHQGGWDEILLVVGPIAVIVGLLAVVRRRVGNVGNVENAGNTGITGNTGRVGNSGHGTETGAGTDEPDLNG